MQHQELIPHLFRTEFGKMVSVLCKSFGLSNIQFAEDLVSETFLKASETWSMKGVPENPTAWLYRVAKNTALDEFKRNQIYREKVLPELLDNSSTPRDWEFDMSDSNVLDSQLQMLFTVCDPRVSKEAQISMALRILCGFGIEEIANAFLTSKSTINKRLVRAKSTFREHNIDLRIPKESDLPARLESVLSVLYLLFNEGYYSNSSETKIKKSLCLESMRLLYLLLEYPPTNSPASNALMALFCFHSSRLEARLDHEGEIVLYDDQDVNKWNKELIIKGEQYLRKSASGQNIYKYHLEATIAFWHTQTGVEPEIKWENILQIYNRLIQIEYSPVTALNRTYALAMARGKRIALKEAKKIKLEESHLYHSMLAFLYEGSDISLAQKHLEQALKLASSEKDRVLIAKKISLLEA